MDLTAVEMAEKRFAKACRSLEAFKNAKDYPDAEEAWTDFLMAASTIYTKLEQGAKGNGKSVAWFGRMKKERRDNPILRYLHAARNSDEHGIKLVTQRGAGSNVLGKVPAFGEKIELPPVTFVNPDGSKVGPMAAWVYGPNVQLVRVHDTRYGDWCDPPIGLGDERFVGTDPAHVGDAAIPRLRSLIDAARALVLRSS